MALCRSISGNTLHIHSVHCTPKHVPKYGKHASSKTRKALYSHKHKHKAHNFNTHTHDLRPILIIRRVTANTHQRVAQTLHKRNLLSYQRATSPFRMSIKRCVSLLVAPNFCLPYTASHHRRRCRCRYCRRSRPACQCCRHRRRRRSVPECADAWPADRDWPGDTIRPSRPFCMGQLTIDKSNKPPDIVGAYRNKENRKPNQQRIDLQQRDPIEIITRWICFVCRNFVKLPVYRV